MKRGAERSRRSRLRGVGKAAAKKNKMLARIDPIARSSFPASSPLFLFPFVRMRLKHRFHRARIGIAGNKRAERNKNREGIKRAKKNPLARSMRSHPQCPSLSFSLSTSSYLLRRRPRPRRRSRSERMRGHGSAPGLERAATVRSRRGRHFSLSRPNETGGRVAQRAGNFFLFRFVLSFFLQQRATGLLSRSAQKSRKGSRKGIQLFTLPASKGKNPSSPLSSLRPRARPAAKGARPTAPPSRAATAGRSSTRTRPPARSRF